MTGFLEKAEEYLANGGIYILVTLLFAVSIYGMVVCSNFMKKLMCMNIMQVAVIFFFLTFGQKEGSTIPVLMHELLDVDSYANPLPHALMLTAIVVSLGTTGVGLALLMRIKDIYGSIDEADIIGRKTEQIDGEAEV